MTVRELTERLTPGEYYLWLHLLSEEAEEERKAIQKLKKGSNKRERI